MNNNFYTFKKSHNLINRIYNMLIFLGTIKNTQNEKIIKKFLNRRIEDVEYIETLAKYFESRRRRYKKHPEVLCNLNDLIYDLEYLKQYLF